MLEEVRYADALGLFRDVRERAGAGEAAPAFRLRVLQGEAWARIRLGELAEAMTLLEQAATLAVGAGFTDVDRAEIVFRVGVVRYSESSITEAIVLFDQALVLAEGADSCPPIACARTSSTGARAATGATATGWPPRRTSSARSSWPRRARTRAGSPMRSSRRPSSLSGRGVGCSHAPTPSGRVCSSRAR